MRRAVVFDTNILISSLLSLRGNPFRCVCANYIITGDRRHLLPLKIYKDVQIISAVDFLAVMLTDRD